MSTQGQGERVRRVTIEIPLPSRPKRLYCSGPPPPRITLVPPRDSTAYIVNKLVLPSGLEAAANLHTQRRLYYTVGWTDLPGAKVAVLASRVLEYVSPRELEDWEYNDLLRREEEKKLAQREAAATPVKMKKKPGRPRKGPSATQQEAEAAAAAAAAAQEPSRLDSETEAMLAEKKAAGGPSLSTPSKRKLEELFRETEAEETGTDSESAALMRQLYSEGEDAGYPSEAPYGGDMDLDSEAVDLLEPGVADLSSRASSLAPALPKSFARASPVRSASRKPSSAGSPVAFPPAPASLPGDKSKALAEPAVKQTPTPLQQSKPRPRTDTRAGTPLTPASSSAPPANAGAPSPRGGSSGFTPIITPVPVPAGGPASTQASFPVPNISTPGSSNTKLPAPPPPASAREPQRKKRRKERKKKAAEADVEEEEWKVKRLEADRYDYDANGNLVRYFKVLWEGDWPPSENPTWEPEENISEDLKEEYLRRKESRMKNGYLTTTPGKSPAKSSATERKKPGPLFLPKKRYSSVAEAFEGEIRDLDAAATAGAPAEDDDGDGEETFVVTDEPRSGKDKNPAANFSAFDQKLASYRSTFGRES